MINISRNSARKYCREKQKREISVETLLYANKLSFLEIECYFPIVLTVSKDARSISASGGPLITALNNFDHRCL